MAASIRPHPSGSSTLIVDANAIDIPNTQSSLSKYQPSSDIASCMEASWAGIDVSTFINDFSPPLDVKVGEASVKSFAKLKLPKNLEPVFRECCKKIQQAWETKAAAAETSHRAEIINIYEKHQTEKDEIIAEREQALEKVQEADEKIAELESELEACQRTLRNIQAQHDDQCNTGLSCTQQNNFLRTDLAKLQLEHDSLQEKSVLITAKAFDLEAQLSQAAATITAGKKYVSRLQRKQKSAEVSLRQATEVLGANDPRFMYIHLLSERVDTIESLMAVNSEKIGQIREMSVRERMLNLRIENVLEAADGMCNGLLGEKERVARENWSLRQQVREFEQKQWSGMGEKSRVQNLQGTVNEVTSQNAKLMDDITSLQQARDEGDERLANALHDKEVLQSRVEKLQAQVEELGQEEWEDALPPGLQSYTREHTCEGDEDGEKEDDSIDSSENAPFCIPPSPSLQPTNSSNDNAQASAQGTKSPFQSTSSIDEIDHCEEVPSQPVFAFTIPGIQNPFQLDINNQSPAAGEAAPSQPAFRFTSPRVRTPFQPPLSRENLDRHGQTPSQPSFIFTSHNPFQPPLGEEKHIRLEETPSRSTIDFDFSNAPTTKHFSFGS